MTSAALGVAIGTQLELRLGEARYPMLLGTDWPEFMIQRLLALQASSYLVVCDTNIAHLYGQDIVARLAPHAPAHLLTHPAGEPGKDLAAVAALSETALQLGADRGSIVLAVGGGITGNLAGLLAALLFRGIRLVHIPTTLIAVLDSVMSLKQAVNTTVGKNLIGTFYAPVEVLADTAMMRTLPARETISGLCEAIKNALAIRPEMIDLLLRELRPDARYDAVPMHDFILESLLAKGTVTIDDQRECRAGLVLEYGHTIGHAIEHAGAGSIAHGQAIGLGMIAAAEISHRLGHLHSEAVDLHRRLLTQAGSPTTIPAEIDPQDVIHRLAYDNKRGYLKNTDDHIAMVLLEDYGQPIWHHGRPLLPVPTALVHDVIHETLTSGDVDLHFDAAQCG